MNNHEKEISEYKAKVAKLESELEQVIYSSCTKIHNYLNMYDLYDINGCDSGFLSLNFNGTSEAVKSVKIYVELEDGIKHFEFKREEEKSDD
jgi:hypothetical protein